MKKKLFKRISLLLAVFSALSFSACSGCNPNSGDNSGNGSNNEELIIKNTDIKLTNNSSTNYKIVIPQAATECISHASRELQTYLRKSTGANFQIIDDSDLPSGFKGNYISLGETALFEASELSVGVKELNRDGFKIKRIDNSVVICGAKDIGTLYGVYEFLEHQIDFEAYASDEVYYQEETTVLLKDFNLVDIPSFEGRTTDGPIQFDNYGASMLRMRNYSHDSAMYDYGARGDFIFGHSESYAAILPKEIYQEQYPEWYADATIQMCLTNEDLIAEAIKRCIAQVQAEPNGKFLNISNNDGNGWCTCSKCSVEIDKYTTSGYVIRFVNKIVTAVEEWRIRECAERDLLYSVFAYAAAAVPPTIANEAGEIVPIDASCVPHDKISIRLVAGTCQGHGLNDEDCSSVKNFYTYFKNWRAISKNEMTVYDYCANYDHYLMFLNNYSRMKTNFEIYKNELNISNVYVPHATNCTTTPFNALSNYLMGKLMWNVNLDANKLMDEFFSAYYKEAAPYVREYFEYNRAWIEYLDATRKDGFHQGMYGDTITLANWPVRVLEQGQELLQKALKATEQIEDSYVREIVYNRVLSEVACSKYPIAKNYTSYYSADRTSFYAFLDQWQEECIKVGAHTMKEQSNQAGGTITAYVEALKATVQ